MFQKKVKASEISLRYRSFYRPLCEGVAVTQQHHRELQLIYSHILEPGSSLSAKVCVEEPV